RFSLDHIWIDEYGQARLLTFPLRDSSLDQFPLREWSSFIHEIAFFALKGVRRNRSNAIPNIPLPECARATINHICGEDGGLKDPGSLLVELEAIPSMPSHVSRVRRAAVGLTMILPALSIIVYFGSISPRVLLMLVDATRAVGYRPDFTKMEFIRGSKDN